MGETDERSDVEGQKIVLGEGTKVFQRVTPRSSVMFFVCGLLSDTEVEIGGPEDVVSFFYDHNRQRFVPWRDSGQREPQYFRLADLPPIVRMALSPISNE